MEAKRKPNSDKEERKQIEHHMKMSEKTGGGTLMVPEIPVLILFLWQSSDAHIPQMLCDKSHARQGGV